MQPKTVRLSYSLSLSVLPDFISQDYRFGFLSTIKHNSSRLIGAVSLIIFLSRASLQVRNDEPHSGKQLHEVELDLGRQKSPSNHRT